MLFSKSVSLPLIYLYEFPEGVLYRVRFARNFGIPIESTSDRSAQIILIDNRVANSDSLFHIQNLIDIKTKITSFQNRF